MGAKIRPKIENIGKKSIKKLMQKIDAEGKDSEGFLNHFGSIFGAGRGAGGEDFRIFQIDTTSFDTRDPGGVRRIKKVFQNRCQNLQKTFKKSMRKKSRFLEAPPGSPGDPRLR